MKICKKCKEEFPNSIKINGVIKSLHTRVFCLKCSPYNLHNTKDISKQTLNKSTKFCYRCKTDKSITLFYKRRDNDGLTSYCKECLSIHALEAQQTFKKNCVTYKGGKCEHCNYDKYIGALEFHHIDPKQKDFAIGRLSVSKMNDKIKAELDKCILLCSNCHKEEHARLRLKEIPTIGVERFELSVTQL